MAAQLKINGFIADLDGVVSIPLTKQFDDLTNPAAIKNAASKTVKIPATPVNNAIFGNIWRIDHINADAFDASKRVPFTLSESGMLLMSGYLKLSYIIKTNGTPQYYEVNLYGELGGFFYELSDRDLRDIDFPDSLNHTVNVDTVMGGDAALNEHLRYMLAYNGKYENFESGKVYNDDNPAGEQDEHQRGEFRSYYQRPALKVSDMINRIIGAASYDVNLGASFFHLGNPYWDKTWISMPQYDSGVDKHETPSAKLVPHTMAEYWSWQTAAQHGTLEYTDESDSPIWLPPQRVNLPGGMVYGVQPYVNLKLKITVEVYDPLPYARQMRIANDVRNDVLLMQFALTENPNDTIAIGGAPQHYISQSYLTFTMPANASTTTFELSGRFSVRQPYSPLRAGVSYLRHKITTALEPDEYHGDAILYDMNNARMVMGGATFDLAEGSAIDFQMDYQTHSDTLVGKKDIIPSGTSQMSFLTNYCKLFGLICAENANTGAIDIMTRNEYFADYQILDWTDRIDYSKEVKTTPLNFNYRYASMSWGASATKLAEQYKEKYGQPYGSMRINTGYEFDAAEKVLIENNIFQNGVMSMEYMGAATTRRDDKVLPAFYSRGDSNVREKADTQFVLLFFEGYASSAKTLRYTDDVSDGRGGWLYSWTSSGGVSTTQYPSFTRLTESGGKKYSLDFGKPSEVHYPVTDEEYPADATIYSRYWRAYMAERLSNDTRVMSCYVWIPRAEFAMWKFNTFVKIGDTLWHVNKIADYDVQSMQSTKVELVRVNDLEAYINGQNL